MRALGADIGQIVLRADSGFARDELMAWCEASGVDYVFGLARNQRLVLARDRFGEKPLYLYEDPRGLFFASEIKAILADADVSREQNRTGIVQFFSFGQLWNDETLFESVRVLPWT